MAPHISSSHRPPKPQKRERPITPNFWDDLSRLWLTPGFLKEFDRRTVRPFFPPPPDRARLKLYPPKRLQRFARRGGPSLRDLRAYPHPAKASSNSLPRKSIMSARRVSHGPAAASRDRLTSRPYTAKDAVFEQILNDAGVYGHRYDAEVPSNLEEIKERLLRPRRSLSPSRFSRQEFRNFQAHVHDAKEESDVRRNVIPVLAGQNVTIASAKNRSFKGLPPLTKANIADAKPDFYDGSGPWDLNQRVLDEIGDKIIPCPEKNLPLLPNFFLEAKGPMAPFPIGFRQALQDNGLGARAMDSLRFYGEPGSKTYDKKALSISTVYQSGRLDLYGTYSTPPSAGADQDGSQMIEIDCWRLDRDWDGFRRGASAFRNAREWAKEQRDEAIRCANAKAVALARGGSAADTDESGVPGAVEEHDRGGAAPGPGWCWWGW